MRTIVWFRSKDLRVSDHAPLSDAVAAGETIPLYVLEPGEFGSERAESAPHRAQYQLEALKGLNQALRARGSRLVLVEGNGADIVPGLADRWGADRVVAHRSATPDVRSGDEQLSRTMGARFRLYEGETLATPGDVLTRSGTPYRVFTQFARTFEQVVRIGDPLAPPDRFGPVPECVPQGARMPTWDDLRIEPNDDLIVGGEIAALGRLTRLVGDLLVGRYETERDRPDLASTSRLSADLAFGTISIRQVWQTVRRAHPDTPSARSFLRQLLWREFSHDILWHRPDVVDQPFRREFVGFPWRTDLAELTAWEEGRTGYPLVDAAARQLLAEGFVHNRARMVSAAFLTKYLMLDYRLGEAHYARYLVDGDVAQNNTGWQWSAGCGCDAQPYFRVFNPVRQGERFDPKGNYVRRWVPELSKLPTPYIHRPWEAPADVLRHSGVEIGRSYPRPMVGHAEARERFLGAARRHLGRPVADGRTTGASAPIPGGVP